MSSVFLAFAAVLLTSMGGRDQLLVAQLSARLQRRVSLLVVGCMAAIVTALAMGWAGHLAGQILPNSGKPMLAAFALLCAAVELAWPIRPRNVQEPTRSLFAITVVILARQLGDAGRFLVFAVAAATPDPYLAGAGGALGGCAAITLGWLMQDRLLADLPLRASRRFMAAIVLIAALVTGLSARGLL